MITEEELKKLERDIQDSPEILDRDVERLFAEIRRLNAAYAQIKIVFRDADGPGDSLLNNDWYLGKLTEAFEGVTNEPE